MAVGGSTNDTKMDDENANEPVRVEYDESCGRYRVTFDPDAGPPSLAIVKAMAQITAADPMELPTLAVSTNVDVETLDGLFGTDCGPERPEPASVTCTYLGHRITVRSDGSMDIEPPAE